MSGTLAEVHAVTRTRNRFRAKEPRMTVSSASPPRRPASSISAARAPRCSTGFSRAITAANSACASRTPTARARPREAVAAIINGLNWLGLNWDGEIVYQSARAERHAEAARQIARRRQRLSLLLRRRQELEAMREQAQAPKGGRCAMTAPGATATRATRRRTCTPVDPPQGAARRRDRDPRTMSRARSRSPTSSSTT